MRAAACIQVGAVHMTTSQSIFWALVYHPPSALCASNNQAVALHLSDLQKGLAEWRNNPLLDILTWDKGFIFWICSPTAVSTNQPAQSNLFFFQWSLISKLHEKHRSSSHTFPNLRTLKKSVWNFLILIGGYAAAQPCNKRVDPRRTDQFISWNNAIMHVLKLPIIPPYCIFMEVKTWLATVHTSARTATLLWIIMAMWCY